MIPELLYSRPYYNSAPGRKPRSGITYRLCQQARINAYKIPGPELQEYVRALPKKCILIPVPGHFGRASHTRDLCNCLQKAAGISKDVRIIDALLCESHPSLCEMKRAGKSTDDIEIRMSINLDETSRYDLSRLSETFTLVLVDNVLDTGKTLTAAADAVGTPCKALTLGYTGNDTGISQSLTL